MTASLPRLDFDQIREHESSQQRAFEELGFVLVPTIERLPAATRLVRRGTPDAGIEFSCAAPDGVGVWAWQAKYLFSVDDSVIRQMQESAYEAMEHEPTMSRYTFILPTDRPSGQTTNAAGRKVQSAMEKWKSAVLRWETEAARRGLRVTFDYIGHSDLVKALTSDQHAGHLRYFFDQMAFTDRFCADQVAREVLNLGDRYLPQVHVEVELSSRFESLARTPAFRDEVRGALVRVKTHSWFGTGGLGEDQVLIERIDQVGSAVDALLEFGSVSGPLMIEADDAVFTKLAVYADAARTAGDRANEALRGARDTAGAVAREYEAEDPTAQTARARCRVIDEITERIWRLRGCLDDLILLVRNATSDPVLLVSGSAGCGKSHMVADLAVRRTQLGLPTLLLRGQQFAADRQAWSQVSEAIELDLLPADLLATLSAAAQARRKGKALLIIDGLNEGAGVRYWRGLLPGLISTVEQYPWVALVLTVRDTYRAGLTPNVRMPLTEVRHPGLAGHEEEALAIYAEFHGLRVTDIPPLNPEMRNPLFLGSLCRSVKARGMTEIPRDATSLTWVFDGLIEWVNTELAERLDYDAGRKIVRRAVAAIATRMLEIGSEALPLEEAEEICNRFLARGGEGSSRTLLHGLTLDSILLQEPTPRRSTTPIDDDSQQVRFTYQRLADHLRSEVILDRSRDLDSVRTEINVLMTGSGVWNQLGLLEALTLLIPERHGIELIDLLAQEPSASANRWLHRNLAEYLITTLAWRSSISIRPETIDLAVRSADDEELATSWLNVQLSLACVADHPLNADRLHAQLAPQTLADRDLSWSYDLVVLWGEDDNAIARLITWAWSGRVEGITSETRRLAGQTLAWFLTSPNRRIRDSATKALLRLMDGTTLVLADLVDRFANVNDPYVTERISAISYGHLLRHRNEVDVAVDGVELLAKGCVILHQHSAQSGHILQRWSSAQAIEIANTLLSRAGRATVPAVPDTRTDDESWRLNAPTLAELATTYQRDQSPYLFSLSTFGYDFEKYVIRHVSDRLIYRGQDDLITQRADARARRQEFYRRDRASSSRTNTAVRAAMVRSSLAALIEDEAALDVPTTEETREAASTVTNRAKARLAERRAATARSRADVPVIPEPERPDHETVGRWISQRVHDMGWTDERFSNIDRVLANSGDREIERTERFGKKYAWIAFHEVLGHLTDHCVLMESYDDTPQPYVGPWQVTGLRDIDPSDATRGDTPTSRIKLPHTRPIAPTWWLRNYQLNIPEDGDHGSWLDDNGDIPDHLGLLSVTDPNGYEWLALECHVTWTLRYGTNDAGHLVRQQWMRSQSYIIDETELPKIKRWAPRQNWMGIWLPTPGEYAPGLLGEYPDLVPWPAYLVASAREATGTPRGKAPDPDPDWSTIHTHRLRSRMALTTARNVKRGSNDMSSTDLANRIVPSRLILDLLNARWAPTLPTDPIYNLGPDERELKWHDPKGLVAFTSFDRDRDGQSAVWVKAQSLRTALAERNLAMWTWSLGEKIPWNDERTPSSERTDIYAAHQYAPGPAVTWLSTAQRT